MDLGAFDSLRRVVCLGKQSPRPRKFCSSSRMQQQQLRFVSYQNILAARKIQSVYRGYLVRVSLWRWGGKAMVSRVVKIQRVWRGFKGKRRGLAKLMERRHHFANVIKGSYYVWQAKKLARILRVEYIQRKVVNIQCLFRSRIARERMRRMRFALHCRMALKIGKLARGYLGRRRHRGIKARATRIYMQLTSIMSKDIQLAQRGIKMSLETLSFSDSAMYQSPLVSTSVGSSGNEPVSDAASVARLFGKEEKRYDPWRLMDLSFFHLIGTNRRELALDIASELVRQFPWFPCGPSLLQVILLLTWTCSGKTDNIRQDYLEEAVELFNFYKSCAPDEQEESIEIAALSQQQQTHESQPPPPPQITLKPRQSVLPAEHSADAVSLFKEGTMEELEYVYFKNAFDRHGKNAHSLSLMTMCALIRIHENKFGCDPASDASKKKAVLRAKRLLGGALSLSTANKEEFDLRVEMLDNLFVLPHRSISQTRIKFGSCRMMGFDAYMKIHALSRMQLQDAIVLDVQIVTCGETVLVKAMLDKLPMSLMDLHKVLEHNHLQNENLVASPKWTSTLSPLLLEGHACTRVTHIRPLVLMAKEAELLCEVAVKWFASTKKLDEEIVRQTGAHVALSEYLFANVRVVTCRNRSSFLSYNGHEESDMHVAANKAQEEFCGLRLCLPPVEYKRLEKNNARTYAFMTKVIQRVHRGHRGRARFRRFAFRAAEVRRQKDALAARRHELLQVRQWRHTMLGKIQAATRFFLWRRLMKKLHRAATVVQSKFRQFRAKRIVADEIKRLKMGPEVKEMLRRGMQIGKRHITLIVYRCGDNYRLVGHDNAGNAIYEGNAFRPEVEVLLESYNAKFPERESKEKIRLWHHPKVAELIASSVGMVQMIPALSTPLGASAKGAEKIAIAAVPNAVPETSSISKPSSKLSRILKDQRQVISQYNKILAARAKIEAGTVAVSAVQRFLGK